MDIATAGGLFLRKNATGVVANMVVGGILNDTNPTPDSTCEGLSNPYNGAITFRGVLPLTLLEFYGRYKDKTVTLSWNTDGEINTKYFTIEKSFDQVSFNPLTNIASSSSTQHNKSYQYLDNTSLKRINYYRLKMVDADGRFTNSKTIAIAARVTSEITVFPNPVKDKIFIRLAAAPAQIEIIIADAKGTCVKKFRLNTGVTTASINTSDLPAGVYSISFQSGRLKNVERFIKE